MSSLSSVTPARSLVRCQQLTDHIQSKPLHVFMVHAHLQGRVHTHNTTSRFCIKIKKKPSKSTNLKIKSPKIIISFSLYSKHSFTQPLQHSCQPPPSRYRIKKQINYLGSLQITVPQLQVSNLSHLMCILSMQFYHRHFVVSLSLAIQ